MQYLHRTVKDFLETPQVWDRIILAGPRNYDPYLALCRSFIAQLKCLDPGSSTLAFKVTVKTFMRYASLVQDRLEEGQSAQSFVSLIDEFDRTAMNFHEASIAEPSWPCKFVSNLSINDLGVTKCLTFLSLAVRLGLHTYVEAKVHHGCLTHDSHDVVPLLSHATMTCTGVQDFFPNLFPSVEMVKMLLEHGADPNMVSLNKRKYFETTVSRKRIHTVWHDLLRHVTQSVPRVPDGTRHRWTEVIYWFLVYGADATVDLGPCIRALLKIDLSKDKFGGVLAIMKAGRRQTWFTEKNPNLDASGHFKMDPYLLWRWIGEPPEKHNLAK